MSSLFLQQEFTELRVEEAPEERRPEESPRPGSSSSSAEDHLHPNSHGTPEHLSSRPSLLLRNSSTDASSSSSFSRKSSIRSTDSVAAVPVKTPLRTPVQTPAVSRCPSNIIRYPGFPGTATSSRAPSMPCSPDHATNLMHTSAPGAAVYPGPSASISASANRLASPPPKRPRLPSHIHSDPPVTFYEPALSNAPSPATSSRNPSLPPTPSLYSARASKLDARLDPPAAAVTQRRSAEDFDFGPILGEGSYSTVFQVTEKADPSKSYALKVLDKRHIVKVLSFLSKTRYACADTCPSIGKEAEVRDRRERHPLQTRATSRHRQTLLDVPRRTLSLLCARTRQQRRTAQMHQAQRQLLLPSSHALRGSNSQRGRAHACPRRHSQGSQT